MEVRVLNGFNSVEPMNGFNSVTPMNGFNSVTPMNGFNSVIPLNGNGGRIWYVAPISLMDIDDVPTDWIPTGLSDEDIMYLKTAYVMGDPEALNGKLGAKLKAAVQKVGDKLGNITIGNTNVGQTFDEKIIPVAKQVGTVAMKAAQVVVPAVLAAVPGGQPLAAASAIGIGAINKKIASDQAAKQAAQAGLSQAQQAEAALIAAQSQEALENIGIQASPKIVADRSVLAVDAGTKSSGGWSISQWWSARSTTEKVLIGGGTALVVGGTIYYFSTRKKKGRKK